MHLWDDSIPTLRELRARGLRTAIVSNCDHATRPIVDDLGLAFSADNPVPYSMVLGTILFGVILYWIMRQIKARQGINVEFAFAEIPPE